MSIPSGFCGTGFSSLNAAFIIALVIDLFCQVRATISRFPDRSDGKWHTDIHVFLNLAVL
jgi:hypothetical protein